MWKKANSRHFWLVAGASLTLSGVLIFSTVGPEVLAQSDWRTKYELRKQEVNSQMDRVRTELEASKRKLLDLSAMKNSLREQIAQVETEIRDLEKLTADLEQAIDLINYQIAYKEEEIKALQSQMVEILREIQIQQRTTPLELVLTSRSLGEAISRVYNLSSLQVRAEEIRQDIVKAKQELEDNKAKLEESRKALQESKALAASRKSELELLLVQTQGEEAKYQQWLQTLQDQEKQLKAKQQQIEREMREEEARNTPPRTSSNPPANPPAPGNCWFEDGGYISASLIRPAQGAITGTFGCPPSRYIPGLHHDGIDIANAIGTPIYATAAGIVERKGFEADGFGYFVMLRHNINGERFYSIYAHLAGPSPKAVGEFVNQGDVIGSMGNTGRSTGPHLHFGLISPTYENTGSFGCALGSSKCYNPARFIRF